MTFSALVDPSNSTGALAASLELAKKLSTAVDRLPGNGVRAVALPAVVAGYGTFALAAAIAPVELAVKGLFNMIGSIFSRDVEQLKTGAKQFFAQMPFALVTLPLTLCLGLVAMFAILVDLLDTPKNALQAIKSVNIQGALKALPILGTMPDCCCSNSRETPDTDAAPSRTASSRSGAASATSSELDVKAPSSSAAAFATAPLVPPVTAPVLAVVASSSAASPSPAHVSPIQGAW